MTGNADPPGARAARKIWGGSIPGTGRGSCLKRGISCNFRAGDDGKRHADCDSGYLGSLPYAGCAGNAVPSAAYRSGRSGRKAVYVPPGRTNLSFGGLHRGYSFDAPLKEGGRLVFGDMALYTMVKNNTFNGMPLPSIVYRHEDGTAEVVRRWI